MAGLPEREMRWLWLRILIHLANMGRCFARQVQGLFPFLANVTIVTILSW